MQVTTGAPVPLREYVRCELCGADDAEPLVFKNGNRVVRCRQCSLVYVNPRLTPRALVELYENPSYQHRQATRAADAAADTAWRRVARSRLRLLERHAGERGALLDVGCSTGWFLGAARDAGWRVTGIDVSAGSIARAQARGFDARLATLDTQAFPDASFQALVLFDSIEHMPQPMNALRAAHRLLAPGGVIMLTTPNVEGALPRLTYRLLGRTLGVWEHPDPPGHIFQFGQKTLAAALERTGFAPLYQSTEAIDPDHTVGSLEDAAMDVLKGRARRPTDDDARLDAPGPPPRERMPTASGRPPGAATRLARRALRQFVRAGAWMLTGAVAVPAPLFGAGDSLIVIARKR